MRNHAGSRMVRIQRQILVSRAAVRREKGPSSVRIRHAREYLSDVVPIRELYRSSSGTGRVNLSVFQVVAGPGLVHLDGRHAERRIGRFSTT